MQLALHEPDIPQNTGTILRLGACLAVPVHVIEPAGFNLSDKALKRAGLDYLAHVELIRHDSLAAFLAARGRNRLILMTTRGDTAYTEFAFRESDILVLGRESAGAPKAVHDAADARLHIPMRKPLRSLNVALAAAMGLGEALRQISGFPDAAVSGMSDGHE